MLSTVCRPHPGWNQKVDDVDSQLPHHQPVRGMSTSWSHPPTPSLMLFFKMLPRKPLGSSGLLSSGCPGLLAWHRGINCTFLHHNPVSVEWLYCTWVNGPKSGSVTWRQTWDIPHQLLQHIFLKSNLARPHAPLWRDQKDERFSFLLKLFFRLSPTPLRSSQEHTNPQIFPEHSSCVRVCIWYWISIHGIHSMVAEASIKK